MLTEAQIAAQNAAKTDGTTTATTTEAKTETATTVATDATQGGEAEAKKTFTQDEMNRVVGDRATRAKATAQAEMLETLGVATLEDALGIIEGDRQKRESEMSEIEKLTAQVSNAKTEAEKAIATRNAALIGLALQNEAPGLGVDVANMKLLSRVIDTTAVTVTGDVVEGIAEAIEAAVKDFPQLKSKIQTSDGNTVEDVIDSAKKSKVPGAKTGDGLAEQLMRKHGSI